MVPPIATAKTCLTYPLYAADFDPNSNSFLLVGGGGGEGRSGVGNKIVRQSFWSQSYAPAFNNITTIDPSRCVAKADTLRGDRYRPIAR